MRLPLAARPPCSARFIGDAGFSIGIDDVSPAAQLQREKAATLEKGCVRTSPDQPTVLPVLPLLLLLPLSAAAAGACTQYLPHIQPLPRHVPDQCSPTALLLLWPALPPRAGMPSATPSSRSTARG